MVRGQDDPGRRGADRSPGGRGRRRAGEGTPPRERQSTGFPADPTWFKDAVIYEVPVRAFMDSSGDGIGDLAGLTARLDYLADLGVTAVWVLPFYPSPLRDDGYDISDYLAVHPDYGTLRDARTFIREAHRRGLRVITELVFNHTSDQHAWFQRARRAPAGSADRRWYVWSDTPERYPDVRIIFKDFETSNWSWDPVAGAYYWHRFYSHQPDLNFDEPRVQGALLRIVDYWLEAGVDGLRLDAIPYLYERDGTNGENLPETHAFLRTLRRHIDERYADRMLLAEANQWPEDSVAYFGDGDECHMAFHFPLMPRMFMALRMEDRYPIIDILAQTPDIPATAQWALFLRNHDELTLEMVTDEERDYMYRVYAADPQARINLGIRRRLAPLLGNNRRRIELLNGLLFSLPGTPVIYYGDEIGMGDNVYVGDRNGVRTPMQWSGDRNAGFSSANRQRLYLPVITDPEYHYEAVNVEAQQANPQSLLSWMKRVIGLRKRHPAFGRGTLHFLHPENRRVLAYIREHEDETLLVVANLSRYAQWTELPLGDYEGRVPVELFGSVEFPRIGAQPYLLSLGPHSFLWFRLTVDPRTDEFSAASRAGLPELAWRGDLVDLLGRDAGRAADVLVAWLRGRRWFRGKARRILGATIDDVIPLTTTRPRSVVALLRVKYREGEPETYVLPLTTDAHPGLERMLGEVPSAAIARLSGPEGTVQLVDGGAVPAVYEALLAMALGGRQARGRHALITGRAERALRSRGSTAGAPGTATPMRAEQSNSSATFGDRLVLKLYRTLEEGPNPDVEMGAYLTAHGYRHVPPVLGSVSLGPPEHPSASLAMIGAYVPHEGNLWDATRDAVEAFLQDVAVETESPTGDDAGLPLLELSRREPPPLAWRLLGTALHMAGMVGRRVGEMHVLLAAGDPADRDFAPEPLTPFHRRALFQSVRAGTAESLSLLAQQRDTLGERDGGLADELLAAREGVDAVLRCLRETPIDGQRIRVHGDLHLGQLLDTGSDVVIIDFEGEPARPLGERRLKRPALTDLAGMLRSFHYVAHSPRLERQLHDGQAGASDPLAAWSTFWYRWVSAACIRAYREATAGARFLPSTDAGWSALLEALLLAKAGYELRYELGSRPDWVSIPIIGLLELLRGTASPRPPLG